MDLKIVGELVSLWKRCQQGGVWQGLGVYFVFVERYISTVASSVC